MSKSKTPKRYLGDGAYVEFVGCQIRLYTSNGLFETNEVFLETDMIHNLVDFCKENGVYQSV